MSKLCTNHCIHATAITTYNRAGFEVRHIMTVSGHRNESKIRVFQGIRPQIKREECQKP